MDGSLLIEVFAQLPYSYVFGTFGKPDLDLLELFLIWDYTG